MSKSTLDCSYIEQDYEDIISSITLKTISDAILPPIYLSGGNSALNSNTYTNCLGSLNGGVLLLDESAKVTDTNSYYSLNAAYNGGLFYLKGASTLTVSRAVTFYQH